MELYEHQKKALKRAEKLNRVAFYHDMGLGKTFTGAEKMKQLGAKVNLVICQKSKVNDWYEHFMNHYSDNYLVFDLTNKTHFNAFMSYRKQENPFERVGIINYELAFRRPELLNLQNFTLLLDESSMIQNETAKRSKFILKMEPANVILLSGTPTGGKYEKLWSQMKLLGWKISKKLYWEQYIKVEYLDLMNKSIPIVTGYKNVARLKKKMREYGCQFLKADQVVNLPLQTFQTINVQTTKTYKEFKKNKIVEVDGVELVGDTTLTKMLYERQLCGIYSPEKIQAFRDLVESTNDRLIVFYNFNAEVAQLKNVARELERPVSGVSGNGKNLMNYENYKDSITFVQYQAGAMGLNLQKANKIIYYSLPLSSELFEQSKKRIHRIGQDNPCFYYMLICENSVEEKIYKALEMRKDFTEALFEEGN